MDFAVKVGQMCLGARPANTLKRPAGRKREDLYE
jgi:hypothetical protein